MTRQDAETELQAALAAQTEAQAALLEAQARVLTARAALMRVAPAAELDAPTPGQQLSHAGLMEASVGVLRQAGRPLTLDELMVALEASGVAVGGTDPRRNMQAYLSRWPAVKRPRRGLYAAT